MKACRACHKIEYDKKLERCTDPECGSTDFSDDFSGIAVIVNWEKSEIAKRLEIQKNGHYALKVR